MALLQRVRESKEPVQDLPSHRGVVVSNNEAKCLQQLVSKQPHVQDDELQDFVREFASQRQTSSRLCMLREMAVRVGNMDQLRQLLTSTDQTDLDDLLIYTVERAPAENRKDIISLLLNLSEETKYEMSAKTNARPYGKTAFHVASQYGYHDLLTLLVPSTPNEMTDRGESALHCIVRAVNVAKFISKGEDKETHNKNLLASVKILVEGLNIDINMLDNAGIPAVHIACNKVVKNAGILAKNIDYNNDAWEIVQYLIEKNANIDIFVQDKSARDIIRDKKIDIKIPDSISVQKAEKSDIQNLFELILNKNDEAFELEIKDSKTDNIESLVDSNNGEYTLLQLAVKFGLTKSTSILLDKNANVNAKCSILLTPTMLAVQNCDEKILKILLDHKDVDLGIVNNKSAQFTALHLAVKDNNHKEDCQCVKLICEKLEKLSKLDIINKVDYKNNTALHYAVENRQEKNIIHLLRNKANIFILNDDEIPAFAGIELENLRGYLDDQISIEGSAFDKNTTYKMITNFQFLVTPTETITKNPIKLENDSNNENSQLINIPDSTNNIRDMDSLSLIAKYKIYKPLLTHPLIRSFLHLKWHRFFWLFYLNFMMLAIFTISFSFYIYYLVNEVNLKHGQNRDNSNGEISNGTSSNKNSIHWGYRLSQIVASSALLFLIIREIFQFLISFSVSLWHYLSYIVNIIELALICISIHLLFFASYHAIHTLSAIAILLSFTELVILIGSHPVLTIYYTMLFRVAKDFLYFLLWYSLLVIAFGISFYILFQHCEGEECSQNLFGTIWTSIFKTTVMLQGEFDANNLKFDSFSVTSHFIFLVFFFSMVIVLMNLLNGLAVSDIQIIKNESDIISMETQVKLYAKFEKIIYNNIMKKSQNIGKILLDHTKLLGGLLNSNQIEFILTNKHTIDPDIRNCCNINCFDCNSGKMCCLALNCLKSKHFKKMFPLCFEFEKIINEMSVVHKARASFICNYDSELENERARCNIQREQEKMWSELSGNLKLLLERQEYLEQIITNMRMKLESKAK